MSLLPCFVFFHCLICLSHALNVTFGSPSGSDLIPPGACKSLNSSVIYANNEVDLAEVDIYGFDYDYTLAQYSNALNTLIYSTARDFLVEHFKVCLTSWIKYGDFSAAFEALLSLVLFSLLHSTLKKSRNMIIFPTLPSVVFTMIFKRYMSLLLKGNKSSLNEFRPFFNNQTHCSVCRVF